MRASFNTVWGKCNFKISLIFSEMTLHFNYIIEAVRYGLVKVSYIIQFDVPRHTLDFTQKIIFGSDIYHRLLLLSLHVEPDIFYYI